MNLREKQKKEMQKTSSACLSEQTKAMWELSSHNQLGMKAKGDLLCMGAGWKVQLGVVERKQQKPLNILQFRTTPES